MKKTRICSLAPLLGVLSTGLSAQQPPRRDTTRADSATRLAPVVTTVLRTPLSVARAPYAVTRLGPEQVQGARRGLGIDETLGGVPGVQVDNRFNAALGERISVRGFGARTQFGVRGVRVLVDGIPATMPDGQTTLNHVDLGALGSAEIARGPASALYGNAAGGAILLETAPAPDSAVGATVRVLGGSDGLSRVGTTVGGRARAGAEGGGDWLVGASRLRYSGFRQWGDQASTRATARAGVGRPDASLGAVRMSGAWVEYDAHNPGALSDSLLRTAPTLAFANNLRQQTGEAGHHAQLGLSFERRLGPGAATASAFGLRRRLENPIPVNIVALDRRAGGGRLAYTGERGRAGIVRSARATVGGELQRQRDDRQNFGNALGARGARTLDQLEHVTNAALFAQGDAALGERVTVLAGVRHDRVRFAAADRLVTATNPDDSGERLLSATTPSAGASLTLGRAATVYANASASFETPTTTELANRPTGAGGLNPDLRPQRARSLEAGLKGSAPLGDRGAATWQLAAYTTQLRDALVPFEVPGVAGRQFYRNAGRSRHRGVEASADLAFGGGLTARAAYTLVDARFVEYTVRDTSYAGRRVPGLAPRRLDLGIAWRGANGRLVAIDERAQDRMPATDANRAVAAGYALTDLRASAGTLRLAGVAVAPFGGVTNLFDVGYVTAVTVNAAGSRYFEPGPGRSLYLGAELAVGRR